MTEATVTRSRGGRLREPGLRARLGAGAVFVGAATTFAHVTEDYLTRDPLVRWDVDFAAWLHDHSSPALVSLFQVVTLAGNVAVLAVLTLVVLVLLLRRGRTTDAIVLAVSALGIEVVNGALKLAFQRQRPELAFVHLDTYSYPSGHAAGATAIYALLAVLLARRRRALVAAGYLVLVAAVGFSRLYLGAHYLSDVLAGTSLGLAWAALSTLAWLYVRDVDLARRLPRPLRRTLGRVAR
jgi:membrane-associated phospholipid phosphatase